MAKVLIMYYSKSGNTKKMAELIAGALVKESVEVSLKPVEDSRPEDMLEADAVLIGSPTYYGTMAHQVKKLLDDSVRLHGKLDGKVGAAFSSSANIGGGNETTILDILNAMLIHGMIIQGDHQGDHYGPVSIGAPDDRVMKQCGRLGQRVARLVKTIKAK